MQPCMHCMDRMHGSHAWIACIHDVYSVVNTRVNIGTSDAKVRRVLQANLPTLRSSRVHPYMGIPQERMFHCRMVHLVSRSCRSWGARHLWSSSGPDTSECPVATKNKTVWVIMVCTHGVRPAFEAVWAAGRRLRLISFFRRLRSSSRRAARGARRARRASCRQCRRARTPARS